MNAKNKFPLDKYFKKITITLFFHCVLPIHLPLLKTIIKKGMR